MVTMVTSVRHLACFSPGVTGLEPPFFVLFYFILCVYLLVYHLYFCHFYLFPPFYGPVSTYLTFLKFSVCLARFAKYWRNVGYMLFGLVYTWPVWPYMWVGVRITWVLLWFCFVQPFFFFLALYGFLYYVKLYEWCIVIWPSDLCILDLTCHDLCRLVWPGLTFVVWVDCVPYIFD